MTLVYLTGLVVGLVILTVAAIRVLSNSTKCFEHYCHHGDADVWVRTELKGQHRDFCLCYDCRRFLPGSTHNCPMAHAIYKNCVKFNVVTPVWECPRFVEQEQITK